MDPEVVDSGVGEFSVKQDVNQSAAFDILADFCRALSWPNLWRNGQWLFELVPDRSLTSPQELSVKSLVYGATWTP